MNIPTYEPGSPCDNGCYAPVYRRGLCQQCYSTWKNGQAEIDADRRHQAWKDEGDV